MEKEIEKDAKKSNEKRVQKTKTDKVSLFLISGVGVLAFVMIGYSFFQLTEPKQLKKEIKIGYVDTKKSVPEQLKSDFIASVQPVKKSEQLSTSISTKPVTSELGENRLTDLNDNILKREYGHAPIVLGKLKPTMTVIPITTTVKARLLEPLSNTNYVQTVHAIIEEDLVLENKTKIKLKGAKITGRFVVLKGQDRVYVTFTKMLFPQQAAISIKAVALDYSDQQRGLQAIVDHRVPQRFLKGILETAQTVVSSTQMMRNPILSKGATQVENMTVSQLETEKLVQVTPQYFTLFFDDQLEFEDV